MKTVAVIGAGISGLAAALPLEPPAPRAPLRTGDAGSGGHTNTVLVEGPTGTVPLDTGFLVHNDRTYPNLVRLFGELGVATRDSDMSFAVSCRRTGLEYSSRGANGFFAQRRNLVSAVAPLAAPRDRALQSGGASAARQRRTRERQTLGDFLESRRFGEAFTHRYLFPMASAIWSASLDAIRSFPALTLIRFFDNHGLLSLHAQPTWKVVAGGSHTYIPKLTARLSGDIHQGAAIHSVRRSEDGVTLAFRDRPSMRFDEVVFACHGDQVLPLLADPSDRERDVFSLLHDDDQRRLAAHRRVGAACAGTGPRVVELPARRRPRCAADGDLRPESPAGTATAEQYCVTLNPNGGIDERHVLRRVRLSASAVYARGHPRAAAVGRGERRQSHALLRRLLALRVSRGRAAFGAQSGPRAGSRVVIDSGLFVGTLRHRRFTPVAHAFTYPLFMALLDIDRVAELMRVSR